MENKVMQIFKNEIKQFNALHFYTLITRYTYNTNIYCYILRKCFIKKKNVVKKYRLNLNY